MKELVRVDGLLQLWAYDVGHSRLLFRRTKTPDFVEQLDVLFKNVAYIQSAVSIAHCSIAELSSEETSVEILSMVKDAQRVFRLNGADGNNVIIAGACEWVCTAQEYFEESPLMN